MSFWEFANPRVFMGWTERWVPWTFALAFVCLAVGLTWGFFFTPDDFSQGSTVKIIYVHVPAAYLSLMAYMIMATSGAIGLIWRIKLAHAVAAACAPVTASGPVRFTDTPSAPMRVSSNLGSSTQLPPDATTREKSSTPCANSLPMAITSW